MKILNKFIKSLIISKEDKNDPNTIVEKLEESVIKSWVKRNIMNMNEKLLEIESLLENEIFKYLNFLEQEEVDISS